MVCGFVIGSPWIFLQVWWFVAAGLYPHEKRYVNVYLPFSLGLFLAGVFVCEEFVIPNAIRVLLEFNEWIGLEPDLRLSEWLSFALMLPLVFGISFQTPLVMLFLAKLGIFDFNAFRRFRKIAYFVMAIFAAIITPTPDIPTLLFLWVPMCALYELGIYLAIMAARRPDQDLDLPDSDEVVEV
jgi:sec-independent protein translocase protein TatC